MSYEVVVFEWPAGMSNEVELEEVQRVARACYATPPTHKEKFVELARALLRAFPNASAMESGDKALDEAVYWPDDPKRVSESLTQGAWHLMLPAEQRLEALKVVVARAAELNLAVLDNHIPMAWLPLGSVIPPTARTVWEGVLKAEASMPQVPPRLKLSEARKILLARIPKVLAEAGFDVKRPREFSAELYGYRSDAEGSQRFLGTVDKYYDDLRLSAGITIRNNVVSSILTAAIGTDEKVSISPEWLINVDALLVSTEDQVRRAIDLVRDELLPLAEMASSLEGLDRLLNGDAVEVQNSTLAPAGGKVPIGEIVGGKSLVRLVVAHLAGNEKRYGELKSSFEPWYGRGGETTVGFQRFKRLTEFLEANETPQ